MFKRDIHPSEDVTISRRTALTGAGWLALSLSVAPLLEPNRVVTRLSAEAVQGFIGRQVTVVGYESKQRATLRLVDVYHHTHTNLRADDVPHSVRRDPFSMVFESSTELPQDVYTFRHPRYGAIHLLMTPVFSDNAATYAYEIVVA